MIKKGQRVEATELCDNGIAKGYRGTAYGDSNIQTAFIEWDADINGHNGMGGDSGRPGHCWNVSTEKVRIILEDWDV